MSSAKLASIERSSSTSFTACMTVVWSRPDFTADLGQRAGGELLREVHRRLTRPGDGAGAPRRVHVRDADVIVLGDALLDLLDGDVPWPRRCCNC